MTRDEIIALLRESISLEVSAQTDMYSGQSVEVRVRLYLEVDGKRELLSEDGDYFTVSVD